MQDVRARAIAPARFATGSLSSRLREAMPDEAFGPATVSAYQRARLAASEPICARNTSRDSVTISPPDVAAAGEPASGRSVTSSASRKNRLASTASRP